jgi:HAE1 family hydrophobic/amphiphilic exporter-1/multidrug efflux pump
MTSLAFIFGVLPLALSTGAGAASRRAIGTGVLGGMLTATLLGIFFVPLFYVLIRSLFPYHADSAVPEAASVDNHAQEPMP